MASFGYTLRQLRKSPVFTAVAVLSLALGIGANTAVFSLVNAVLLKTLPVSGPGRLVQIAVEGRFFSLTNPVWEELKRRETGLEKVFAYSEVRFNLAREGETRMAPGLYVSGNYFEALGLRPAAGRLLDSRDDQRGGGASGPVAVLSYGFWQSEFGGDPGVAGGTLSIDGHPFTIAGVAPESFSGLNVGQRFDVAVPLASEALLRGADSSLSNPGHWWLRVMGRLKPGQTLAQARQGLAAIQPEIREATRPPSEGQYLTEPFSVRPAGLGLSFLRDQYRNALLALMGLSLIVLLLACANLANLLLARSAKREHEIAIRLAIGAGRGRVVRQLLGESLILSVLGALAGALFAVWGAALLTRWLSTRDNAVFLDLAPDWRMAGFGAVLTLATALLFGLGPALRATSVPPGGGLKERPRHAGRGRGRTERAVVAVQVALSVVLVCGAGLFIRTFVGLVNQKMGFERKGVLLASVDLHGAAQTTEKRVAIYRQLLDTFRAVPGVQRAAIAEITPAGRMMWNTEVVVDGSTAKDNESYGNTISEGYFASIGQPVLAGRDFDRGDGPNSERVAIVNETFVRKFFGARNALGGTYRELGGDGRWRTFRIAGIAGDAKYRGVRDPVPPALYVPFAQQQTLPGALTFPLRIRGDSSQVRSAIAAAALAAGKNITVEFHSLESQVDEALIQERTIAALAGFFGVLALALAAIGIFGVVSYTVSLRRNEIGVRLALGAFPRRVIALILRQITGATIAGVVLGAALSLLLGRFVATLLWGLKPADPFTVAAAGLVLVLTAWIAAWIPSLRAARIQPVDVLRDE